MSKMFERIVGTVRRRRRRLLSVSVPIATVMYVNIHRKQTALGAEEGVDKLRVACGSEKHVSAL